MRQCSDREGSEDGAWGWREGGQRSIGRGARGEAGVRDVELPLSSAIAVGEVDVSQPSQKPTSIEVIGRERSWWESVYRSK